MLGMEAKGPTMSSSTTLEGPIKNMIKSMEEESRLRGSCLTILRGGKVSPLEYLATFNTNESLVEERNPIM